MNIHRFSFGTFEMLYDFMCKLAFTSLIWSIPMTSNVAKVIKESVTAVSHSNTYRGADKFLAQPGRKQATATDDFEFRISYL
jgi:hypothetical protein